MTAAGSFTYPACGVAFEVEDHPEEPEHARAARPQEQPAAAGERVSFRCPASGADFETQERLARPIRGKNLTEGNGVSMLGNLALNETAGLAATKAAEQMTTR